MRSTTKHRGIRGVTLAAGLVLCPVLCLVLAGAGCGSTASSGIDSGGVPPTPEAAPPGDASDAVAPPNDVRSIFGNGDTGGEPDATVGTDGGTDGTLNDGTTSQDGGSSGDGGDAGHDSATGPKDSGAKDSGSKDTGAPVDTGTNSEGGVCVVVPVTSDTSGEGSCSPVSGMCGPGDVSGYTPKSHPTTVTAPYKGTCTAAEIDTVYQQCFNGGTMCGTSLPCYQCIFSNVGAASWGPAIEIPNDVAQYSLVELNVGGCLDLLEPCNEPCAYALENQSACEFAACGTNCQITSNSASIMDYQNCATAIDTCAPNGCATYSVGAACASDIDGAGHPGAICFANADNFETQFDAIAAVFCGN